MTRGLAAALNAWLVRPVESAAGSLGLFRIVFSTFYLWHLSYVQAGVMAAAPAENWQPVGLFRVLLERPPAWLPGLAECILAGLLVLLLAGLRTRTVTVLVFVTGFLLDGFVQSLGKVEHATVFLTFYLPLMMAFSTWGDRYSIDSLIRREPGSHVVSEEDSAFRHSWPMKLTLLLLSFLFLTAGLSKLLGGHWLPDSSVVSNLVARSYYRSILEGLTPNPFAQAIIDSPALAGFLNVIVPLFECLFALVLIGPMFRRVYISLVVLFHAVNATLLAVTFTPVLIAYGIAVNWEWLYQRVRQRLGMDAPSATPHRSWNWLTPASVVASIAIALDWNWFGAGRQLMSLGGALNWLTIWYVMAPIALISLIRSTADAVRYNRPHQAL